MLKKMTLAGILVALILIGAIDGARPALAGRGEDRAFGPADRRLAEYGNDFKRSVTLVIDKVNKEGGINGKQIALVIADSRGDAKESS